jgi:flavin-dependent dehydrogenase
LSLFAQLEAPVTDRVYDALVIGGGPAGACAALLLARAGWSVILVERKNFPRPKVCGEYLSATNLPLLDRLGLGAVFREKAGPPVRKVGLYAGNVTLQADLPRPPGPNPEWGRALSRERLDTLLLERARQAGADVRQPFQARSLGREGDRFRCGLESLENGAAAEASARIVVAAHGSWDPGTLLTQPPRRPAAPADLLGFKAHFHGACLGPDLMPLLAFPGGYGGMVHCEGNRVSLSCCVRRDRLAVMRHRRPGDAGDTVLEHIKARCRGARQVLEGARRTGAWLGAGPIRPGIRLPYLPGIFPVGNVAGEAHPVIAEGISIALQSAWLACARLLAWKARGAAPRELGGLAHAYAADWRRHFAPRLAVSQLIAQWAMRPAAVTCALPLLWSCPPLLTWFARLSGKAHGVLQKGDRTSR